MNKRIVRILCIAAVLLLAAAAWLLFGGKNTPATGDSSSLVQSTVTESTGETVDTPADSATVEQAETQIAESTPAEPSSGTDTPATGEASSSRAPAAEKPAVSSSSAPAATSKPESTPESTSNSESTSKPESTTPPVADSEIDLSTLTYESYNAMTGEMQQKVIAAFADPAEFVKWYHAAEAQYKAEHPDIEIGTDGSVDAGELG